MKPNTLIDVIPKMGPTFRIRFKLNVEKFMGSSTIKVFSYKSLYSTKDFLELTVTKSQYQYYENTMYEISCLFGEKDGDNARIQNTEHRIYGSVGKDYLIEIEQKLHYDGKVVYSTGCPKKRGNKETRP